MQGCASPSRLSDEEVLEATAVLQLLMESSAQLQDREALSYVAATAVLLHVRPDSLVPRSLDT